MITPSQRQILEAVLEALPEEPGVNKGSIDPLENKLYGYKLALNDVRAIINEFLEPEVNQLLRSDEYRKETLKLKKLGE